MHTSESASSVQGRIFTAIAFPHHVGEIRDEWRFAGLQRLGSIQAQEMECNCRSAVPAAVA